MIKIFKFVLFCNISITSSITLADKFTFCYNEPGKLKITIEDMWESNAYKIAAKMCYKILTNNKYPGSDEAGLAIIDICANPIKCKK